MSYNIVGTEVLTCKDFRIHKDDLDRVQDLVRGPEWSIFHMIGRQVSLSEDDYYHFNDFFAWAHTGSGRSYDELKKDVLPLFKGKADILFTWEDGECSGLRVIDGQVTEHEIVKVFGEEIV
jgi:hypothetical protein